MRTTETVVTARSGLGLALVAGSLLMMAATTGSAQFYSQTNLVSDVQGVAAFTDTNLIGAWGIVAGPTTPWWVNSTFGHVSLLFNATGQPLALVVGVPPTNSSTATGIVFNGGSGFEVASNAPARFIFATLNGTISGWSPSQANKSVAIQKVNNAGAGYSGIALAQQDGQDRLFAANFLQDRIDVFDTNFAAVTMPAGAFSDSKVPANLTVFNIHLVGSDLYVTYAPTNVFSSLGARGEGFVDVFDTNGSLDRRLQHGFWMNAPWGVTLAPPGFGPFSNDVLVGMFGNGAIAAFDARHGRFRGFLDAEDGLPLRIEHGLWGLGFGNGSGSGPTNTLYFASDFMFAGQFHGLFGTLSALPSEGHDGDHDSDDQQRSEQER